MKEAPADVAAAPVQAAKPVSAVDDLLNLDMMGAPASQQPAQQSFDPWRNSGKKNPEIKNPLFCIFKPQQPTTHLQPQPPSLLLLQTLFLKTGLVNPHQQVHITYVNKNCAALHFVHCLMV